MKNDELIEQHVCNVGKLISEQEAYSHAIDKDVRKDTDRLVK